MSIVSVRNASFLLLLCASSLLGESDISNALLKEQAQGLEAVEKPLEEHLQEKQKSELEDDVEVSDPEVSEDPQDIFEAAIPEEIPFEESDENTAFDSANMASASVEPEKVYEKAEALEPALMMRGTIVEEVSETAQKERLRGRIVPEKHAVRRRRHMFRWVLQTDDGRRIPLKSNLRLLTFVRNEEILDGPAMVTGYFVASGMNPDLKFLNVEKIVPAGDSDEKNSSRAIPQKRNSD